MSIPFGVRLLLSSECAHVDGYDVEVTRLGSVDVIATRGLLSDDEGMLAHVVSTCYLLDFQLIYPRPPAVTLG